MEIKLDFKYTENWVPPRCRKPRPGRFDGEVTVNVKEIDDAPVAAIWKRNHHDHHDHHRDPDRDGADRVDAIEIRVHDGEFYIPGEHYKGTPYTYEIKTLDDVYDHIRYQIEGYCNKETIVRRANEAADAVALIDGKPYWKIPEPLWKITHSYSCTSVTVVLHADINVKPYYMNCPLHNINADIDSLVPKRRACAPHDTFDILIPEAFTRDPQSAYRAWQEFQKSERETLVGMLVDKLTSGDDAYPLTCKTPDGTTATARIEYSYDKPFTV